MKKVLKVILKLILLFLTSSPIWWSIWLIKDPVNCLAITIGIGVSFFFIIAPFLLFLFVVFAILGVNLALIGNIVKSVFK